ncbi:MAG: stalk domain-containing protein [bacterium]|nr:stalk domain-containing protein [bacterium]
MKKILASVISIAMLAQGAAAFAAAPSSELKAGMSIKEGDYAESAAETQKLIDNRPDIQRQMENISRGLIAVTVDNYVFLSWRWLGTESSSVLYNVYRDGVLMNAEPLNITNYTDISPKKGAKYQIAPVIGGTEGEKCAEVTALENPYIDVKIEQPPANSINGEEYTYSAGDASVADLDGDGEYEIILKWDPSNSKDAASTGFTGECIIDAYKLDGTRMWRINMGRNIRSGAHDTQFMVYDFDGDGKAEMVCRTADGTTAGDGTVIGDESADWAAMNDGKNLQGPLYLTVFKGEDGTVIDSIPYDPQTTGADYDQSDWGDTYGNRSERYLAGIGSLDGKRTSFVFCRGYYTGPEGPLGGRTVIAAYDLVDGKIKTKWIYDTKEHNNENIGQGNHSMSLADVDYDGCDEIIYGSLAVDNDGTAMYSTGLGHGDSQHVADIDIDRPGLEVYSCHEDKSSAYGFELRDARTGEILYGAKTNTDNGRACAGDIDPKYPGDEGWSAAGVLTDSKGNVISTKYTMAANFLNWWDGDLGREIQNDIYIEKWNSEKQGTDVIFTASGAKSINGTKATPALTADILGDWREETIYPLKDDSALRIYTTSIPTGYRIPTLMSDTQYRNHVALQNTCYNQPTHLSYYLGYDTKTVPVPQMYTVDKDGSEVRNPDLAKKSYSIDELYSGTDIKLVIGTPTALVNNIPKRVDNDNTEVVPYISAENRTLVPIRFISESLGADVKWDEASKTVTVAKDDTTIEMVIGSAEYKVNGEAKTMETAPVITQDRTMLPLRAAAEALGQKVYWNDGLIVIGDVECRLSDAGAKDIKDEIKSAPVPAKVEIVAINGKGEKYYPNQLDVFAATASGNDGNLDIGAVDLDMSTRWSNYGASTLVLDLGAEHEVEGVAIACWKGNERVYPFTIEYSLDGEKWDTALEKSQNTGESAEFEKFMFDNKVKARYIRYSGDGATDPTKNYCHISEIAVLGN